MSKRAESYELKDKHTELLNIMGFSLSSIRVDGDEVCLYVTIDYYSLQIQNIRVTKEGDNFIITLPYSIDAPWSNPYSPLSFVVNDVWIAICEGIKKELIEKKWPLLILDWEDETEIAFQAQRS